VPAQEGYVIGAPELEAMKDGVGIINCARGGVVDEVALIEALDRQYTVCRIGRFLKTSRHPKSRS
jgi:lactate dehydrogenase-like 2-hydroxyacid dehydrogenase